MTQRVHAEGKVVTAAQSVPSHDQLRRSGIRSPEDLSAPEIVKEMSNRPGQPLDPATRAAMEPRFGLDFSRIRVHSDAHAAESARTVGARAYTVGEHMVFDTGQYLPGSPDGQRLLAHELTHVAQQVGCAPAGSLTVGATDHHAEQEADSTASSTSNTIISISARDASPVLRRQPRTTGTSVPASTPDPYRPLTDKIADVQRSGFILAAAKLPVLRKLEELAKAVEQQDLPVVQTATTEFIALDTAQPLDPATAVMLLDVPMVLVSRIFLLGLTGESQRLEGHFFRTMRSAYDQPTRGEGFSTRYAVLHQIVDEVITGAKFDKPAAAERTLDVALTAFKGLNDAAVQLDLAQVRKEQDAARAEAIAHETYRDPLEGLARDRARTPGAFYSGLMGLVAQLVEVMQRAFQVLMDAAVSELEAGTGQGALATAKTVLTTKMAPVLESFDMVLKSRKAQQPAVADPSFGLRRPLTVDVDVTRSNFDKKLRRHLDYFDRSKQAASVEIEAFEIDDTSFAEKSLDVRRIVEIRIAQISTLERLFGLATDNTGKVTAESKQNVDSLRAVAGFTLHGNDSWRSFLLEKFRAARKETQDDWKALTATVAILRSYLSSFTTHTPYNIDEFGDNYLTRTFPRALTGQLIHDCGVYALRVAYALSLVRQELGLTFRAAVMPVHVGLVISFKDIRRGALYVNNDKIDVISGTRLQEFADQWRDTDATGKPLSQPATLDVDKLHAEISAATFAERVDVPVRLVDVPTTPAGRRSAVNKRALWDFYHRHVIKPPAVAPTKGTPQPELKYLAFLKAIKEVHNTLRVPLYRQAHDLFVKHRQELTAAQTGLSSPDPATRAGAQAVLTSHQQVLITLFAPLRAQLAELDKQAAEVNDFMRSHPEAVGSEARLRPAARLRLSADFTIDDYLGDGTNRGLLLSGQITPDGWADENALPRQAD